MTPKRIMIKINVIAVLILVGGLVILMGGLTQAEQKIIVPEEPAVYLTNGRIGKIAYSPDGQLLAVARSIGIFLYDAIDLTEVGVLDETTTFIFSPDGHLLVSWEIFWEGGETFEVYLWDVKTQQELGLLWKDIGLIRSICFGPDGKLLALAVGANVHLWDVATQQRIGLLPEQREGHVDAIAISPDGKVLALAGTFFDEHRQRSGEVSLWNIETQQQIGLLLRDDKFSVDRGSIAFGPDGKILASTGTFIGPDREYYEVRIWDIVTQQQVERLREARLVAISPDNRFLVSSMRLGQTGNYEYGILLWDMESREQIGLLKGHKGWAKSLSFSPDGQTLASGDYNEILLWDVETQQQVGLLSGKGESFTFSPDGKTLISSDELEGVHVWDIESQQLVKQLQEGRGSGGVISLAFSPDGKTLASTDEIDVHLWHVETQQRIGWLSTASDVMLLSPSVNDASFSPNGEIIAAVTNAGSPYFWDMQTQQLVKHLIGEGTSLAFSPDGKTVALGGGGSGWRSKKNTIRLWNPEIEQQTGLLEGHTAEVQSLAFSPDGMLLASGSASPEHAIRLWNVEPQQQIGVLLGRTGWAHSIAFSPDGKTLASGGDYIRLWDVATQQQLLSLDSQGAGLYGQTVSFSPDGEILAFLGERGIILWEILTQQQVGALKRRMGIGSELETFSFSPDGRWLASGNRDGVIQLWELGISSPWDVNSDGIVDVFDLMQVASQFGQKELEFSSDVNGDGRIDVLDLVLVGSHFRE